MALTFSNPRLSAHFEDWPSGARRVACDFVVDRHPGKGCRVLRTTTGKPKASTYAGQTAIVDGSDGKTYILAHVPLYGFIHVMRSDFLDSERGSVWPTDADFAELMGLIVSAR